MGFQLTHTTGTVNANGEIGGTTTCSWHKFDRNGVLLPVLAEGDRWVIQDETNSANYSDILLTGAVTFADPIYSAPATRTDGGAIGEVNARAFPLIRGLPGVGGGTSITLDPDVSNYFSAYASLAFEDQILATNKMVVDLKREGLWPKIELLYVNFGDSIANVLVPLKGTGNATAGRAIVAGDIATAKGGGLEPLPPQLFLSFPQLSSLVNYHLGWAKKPGNEITFSNAIEYTNASTQQGFSLASENTSFTLWFASGVAFNSSAHDLRSWQSGGFVGTATGNTNKLSINPYGRRLTTAANSILPTAPAFVTIRMIGPRQPAFCAGQNLSDVELGVLQGILDTFARNV